MPDSFLDANVLVYLSTNDTAKATRARTLVSAGNIVSVQVLNETANVLKQKAGWSWPEIAAFLKPLRSLLQVEPLTPETHVTGLRIADRYRLALYDAMIVAAALIAGCDTLWSEDMPDGLLIDGTLRIRNPFA